MNGRIMISMAIVILLISSLFPFFFSPQLYAQEENDCDSSYPDVCIPPYPPDLNCSDISDKNFRVEYPDPHKFDRKGDGIGCEK